MSAKSSLKARLTAARLFAVQATYQAIQNKVPPLSLYDEYVMHNVGMDLEEGEMIHPEGILFKKILSGVTDRWSDIEQLLKPRLTGPDVEPLLTSILVCGACELLAHHEIDAPIIISDYLHITHGFFAGPESKMVNGVLDAIAKELRS